jgi:multiple sugar transport system permease protein
VQSRRHGAPRRPLWGLAAAAVSLLFLLPLVFTVSGSFRRPGLAPPQGVELVPASPTLEGYHAAFSQVSLARGIFNSLLVAALFVPVAVATASLAGYGLTQLDPRRRRRWIVFLLVVFVVPSSTLWITRFTLFKAAGVTDTFLPLIAPALLGGSPLLVLLYLLAFRRLPADVLDAARIEGAGHLRAWRQVALPLVRGTTVAVGLLAFSLSWANFIDPLLYLSSESRFTAPLALRSLEQLGPTNWPVMLAGATVVTAPVVVAFAIALRLIIPRRGAGWLGG